MSQANFGQQPLTPTKKTVNDPPLAQAPGGSFSIKGNVNHLKAKDPRLPLA